MRRAFLHALSLWPAPAFRAALLVWLAAAVLSGCTKSYAAAPRPDLSGVWDVVYDDFIDVEVRVDQHVEKARLGRSGGRVVATVRNLTIELDVDCSREELVCPNEVWPTELTLSNRVGDFDDTGEHLTVSFSGEGRGACTLKADSRLGADVESLGDPLNGHWQATTLNLGQVTTVVSGACLGSRDHFGRIEVALSSGITAVLR